MDYVVVEPIWYDSHTFHYMGIPRITMIIEEDLVCLL